MYIHNIYIYMYIYIYICNSAIFRLHRVETLKCVYSVITMSKCRLHRVQAVDAALGALLGERLVVLLRVMVLIHIIIIIIIIIIILYGYLSLSLSKYVYVSLSLSLHIYIYMFCVSISADSCTVAFASVFALVALLV